MSQFFLSGGQSVGDSATASVLPMNIQDWFPLGWTGCISLLSKELSRVFSNTTQFKSINSSVLSFLYSPTLTSIHDYWKNPKCLQYKLCTRNFWNVRARVTQIKTLFIFTLIHKVNRAHVKKWREKTAYKNTRYTFLRFQYLKFDNLQSSIFIAFLFFSKGEKWKLVTQLCLTLWDSTDCSLLGSSVHGIL